LCALLLGTRALFGAGTDDPAEIPPLRPPFGEIPPGFWEQHAIWIVVTAVVLAGLVAAVIFWAKHRPGLTALPPFEEAKRSLDELSKVPEDGPVLTQVSRVVKHYFTETFHLPVGELTTAEFSRQLHQTASLDPGLRGATEAFLQECDVRKFSASPPSAGGAAVPKALTLLKQAEQSASQLKGDQAVTDTTGS
jgi:hypothetical protein